MLQSIRENSKGIVAKIIVGLIVVTFALFGVESLVSLTAGSNAPATVNGEEISERQLLQGVELQRRQLLSQMGENADPTLLDDNVISKMVLDGLVEQNILIQSAQSQGLVYSDQMIDQMLVNTPNFQVDGRFDRVQFESVLRNAGFTPLSYRELLRKEKLIEQQRTAYLLSAFAIDPELERVVALDRQTRDLSYFTLTADDAKSGITVTDDEAQSYFEERRGDYKTEEQVVIEYLLLDKAKMLDDVDATDAEMREKYDALVASFEGQEERKAAHILIEISDEQDSAAAKAKAEQIAERIAAGEAFAELAKAESNDLGSAENGGDLGFNGKGLFVPEFEDALFSLEKGQVSDLIRTEFGYHIIKLDDVKATEAPSFEDVKSDVKYDILREKVEAVYVERLERLADLSFSSGDLVEPAETLELEIITSEAFTRLGGNDDVTSNTKTVSAAFSEELLKEGVNSVPLELDSSRAIVIRVKEHLLPREQEFSEVAAQVKAGLLLTRVAEKLDTQVAEILAALSGGAELSVQAGDREVKTLEAASRSQPELPAEVRVEAFKVAHPQEGAASYTSVTMADGSRAIVAVTGVNVGASDTLEDKERQAMKAVLGSRKGQYVYSDLTAELSSKAVVERL